MWVRKELATACCACIPKNYATQGQRKVREGRGEVVKEFSGSKAGKMSLTKVHKKRTWHEELPGAQEANDAG